MKSLSSTKLSSLGVLLSLQPSSTKCSCADDLTGLSLLPNVFRAVHKGNWLHPLLRTYSAGIVIIEVKLSA